MSTRTGITIVGTLVGAYFGNPQLGYAIGSLVGGMVDPLKSYGPKLTDAQAQTSVAGGPISRIWGSARVAGNIIATGPLVQHKKTDDGKSGQEAITYTYTRTYAIGVCAGPVDAIRRVWRDEKLVYDATPDRDEKTRVANRQWLDQFRYYNGAETQEPDAELQALLGADNVPAFRGLAYFVIQDDDLTDRAGSVPTYQVEIVTKGTSNSHTELKPATLLQNRSWAGSARGSADPRIPGQFYQYQTVIRTAPGSEWFDTIGAARLYFEENYGVNQYTGDPFKVDATVNPVGWCLPYENWQEPALWGIPLGNYMSPFEDPGEPPRVISLVFQRYSTGAGAGSALQVNVPADAEARDFSAPEWGRKIYLGIYDSYAIGSGTVGNAQLRGDWSAHLNASNPAAIDPDIVVFGDVTFNARAVPSCVALLPESDWLLVPGTSAVYVDRLGALHDLSPCTHVTGDFVQLAVMTDVQYPVGPVMEVTDPRNTAIFWEDAYTLAVAAGDMPVGLVYGSGYPKPTDQACFCQNDTETESDGVPLSVIVGDLLNTVGLADSQFDVSQLTDIVDGFVVASQTNCADAVNALSPAYSFDGAEWDGKIRFVKRGLNTIAAVIDTDSVEDDSGSLVVETRAEEVTVPRKLILTYQDQSANYAPVTQTAERYRVTVDATGEINVSTPVVMDLDKAAQMAEVLLKDNWTSIRGTLKQTLADEYSALTPTDVIYITSGEAVFRARLTQVTTGAGTFAYEAVQDSQGSYVSTATGVAPLPPTPPATTVLGPTLAYYLNIPALRDKDDQPGFYVAASGFFDGWRGALIEYSLDGGLTWTGSLTVLQESSLGVTLTNLPAWTPLIPDEEHTVDVVMTSGQLSSTTQAGMDGGANAAWLDGEVFQFRTATLIEDNTYRLSGLVRGRKYTLHGAHADGSGFALLDSVYFLPINRSQIGSTFTMRATTSGASTADGDVRTLDLARDWSVTEWPVTNVRAYYGTDHTAHLAWSPRHRLGTAAAPYASLYFTGYRVIVTSGAASKIYDTTAQTFDYTDAQALADFGSLGPLTFTISALNSITGPSDPTEATP